MWINFQKERNICLQVHSRTKERHVFAIIIFLYLLTSHVSSLCHQMNQCCSRRLSLHDSKVELEVNKRFYIETHGCQMNLADSDVVRSVMLSANYEVCDNHEDADLIMINTCAIRENAEAKIWQRIKYFHSLRKKSKQVSAPLIGVLGCMAERLKTKLLDEASVDFIAGPDAYRDLPNLVNLASTDQKAANVRLSLEETYADVKPVRLDEGKTHAFVTIQRGCDNHCSFCIVPYTRGTERSRPVATILEEVKDLSNQGVREVVLLGQNVNSYWDRDAAQSISSRSLQLPQRQYGLAAGFTQLKKVAHVSTDECGVRFAELLSLVAAIDPEMRIRFQAPHPKDFPDEVLSLIARTPNICKSLHMPAQHGASSVLERMKRGYSREAYTNLVCRAREILAAGTPAGTGLGLSSDFISGFCGETEREHQELLSLVKEVGFDQAFTYSYSKREQTFAGLFFQDDVSDGIKSARLTELIETFQTSAFERNSQHEIGRFHVVLLEGLASRQPAGRSSEGLNEDGSGAAGLLWTGRTDTNKRVVLMDRGLLPMGPHLSQEHLLHIATATSTQGDDVTDRNIDPEENFLQCVHGRLTKGSYVVVRIESARGHTLRGVAIAITSLQQADTLQLPRMRLLPV